ncbi:protein turtle homolog B-like [Notolabrus celidotus]|uniref:protein turtle homolog B-like n=1 Tax=Notolabrus celidotus TaxID=1203425 RepID=UPI00148FB1EE|nr:protein turtle homolog B-like [Notolabrus celidotus]
MNGNDPVDLRSDSNYTGRVEYHFHVNGCTLRIKDLRESDSAEYKFTLRTNKPDQSLTGSPGVSLSVTALQVQVTKVDWNAGTAELKCHSSCSPTGQLSYIWFKNGEKIQTETSSVSGSFDSLNSYTCALKGHEDSPSPPVCVYGGSCNRVMYNKRRICALKGSSVNISCTYYSHWAPNSVFWFSPARSHHWQTQTQPEDLKADSQYAGRVQVFETQRRRSTLIISDLRESDSAEYRFKFKRLNSEWGNSFPGTTLTVTALQVQVTSVTVHQDYTEAVLRCHTSCSPAGDMSYIWFKNGKEIQNEEKSSHEDRFSPGDFISCAVKGLEKSVSPSVYALKAPSVSVNPPGEITEGSSVTLNCSSDANREANYTWLKRNQTLPREEPQLVFSSIQPSDSGEYRCTSENELGKRTSEPVFIDVKCE